MLNEIQHFANNWLGKYTIKRDLVIFILKTALPFFNLAQFEVFFIIL